MRRVTKARRCPICDKPDWCGVAEDDSLAICMRVADGAVKQTRNGGWLHLLQDVSWRPVRRAVRTVRLDLMRPLRADLGDMAAEYRTAVEPASLAALADELGLSVRSLQRLGIGWAGWGWVFPMTDASGTVRGFRIRKRNGTKLALKGGREGLFIPSGLDGGDVPLLLCEGPTDTAALLDLGFDAIGRPSCTGGARLVIELIQRLETVEAVIVADADAPGQHGAQTLATGLVPYVPTMRIITPPPGVKDARAWKQAGATHPDVMAAIETAQARQLSIRVRRMANGR